MLRRRSRGRSESCWCPRDRQPAAASPWPPRPPRDQKGRSGRAPARTRRPPPSRFPSGGVLPVPGVPSWRELRKLPRQGQWPAGAYRREQPTTSRRPRFFPRVGKNGTVLNKQRLRELAALRPEGHKVLSLYLNLDPSEFPTPQAPLDRSSSRCSTWSSARCATDGLPHEQKRGAEAGHRARPLVVRRASSTPAARAAWRCSPPPASDLFDVHRLGAADPQRGHDRRLAVHRAAHRRCRAATATCVLLINRQLARILAGGATACARSSASSTTSTAGTTRAAGRRRASSAASRRRPRTTSSTPATSCSSSSSAAPCSG